MMISNIILQILRMKFKLQTYVVFVDEDQIPSS